MAKSPFLQPFPAAIAFFAKKLPIPTENWKTIAEEYQAIAFTIAGITKVSILKDLQDAITDALEKGISPEKFRVDFADIMVRRGWSPNFSPYRVNLILSQLVRNSYQFGRWEQMEDPDLKRRRPYRQWIHGDSPVPRPHHLQQHLKCYPADSDIWKAIHPSPFGCRCRAFALSDRDMKREGLTLSTPPKLAEVAEPGFSKGYPKSLKEQRQQLIDRAIASLPPNLASLLEDDVKNNG
ncbi:phage head morphogenesis protein [Chroococcidiopsis sp.]|uniref:phage head morphogenesis protein n=1 Tax=Chroococcidiopsis sp. TaxID=3088168 RepID=UPI003F2C6004